MFRIHLFRSSETIGELSLRYGSTIAVVGGAILSRWMLEPFLENAGFSIFLAAILIGAWVGGVGPSLLGQTLLLFAHGNLFTSTIRNSEPGSVRSIVGIGAYYLVGTAIAVLSEARGAARKREAKQIEKIALKDQELQATISSIGDGVLVTDQSGCINFMNPMAERVTGWRQDEALGNTLNSVFRIQDETEEPSLGSPIEQVLQRGVSLRECRILMLSTRDGRQVPITFNATPIRAPSGSISGTVLIIRDETDRRHAEEQLRQMNHRKDNFLATLAHELRNPLAPISTGIQLLKLSGRDPKVAAEVHEIMERQVQHIIRLVDDLLDVSRISRGKLQLRKCPTSLTRVVANAVETMRSLIDGAQHQLILNLPKDVEQIDADPDRLAQIACNLLHNAIKYTPSGGRIELQIEQSEDEIRLIVADNGSGIPADNLDSIFEMFNQGAEDKEKGKSGLGVGLTLARRLAELHGGTIDAQSAGENRGSTFRLRLPIVTRHSLVDSPDQTGFQTTPSIRRRVLLVDDNEDGLRAINLMIQALGSETCVARDGLEALDVAETFRPEVIFMDLGMPKLNGYEAAERLRQKPWGKDILLIAVTGWGQERDRQRTLAAGFDDHLVKPVGLEALRSCLERKRSQFSRVRCAN